ncbi:MAG: hypothetical protein JWP87_219 [Labilithrix sp.]|nr:hypothetical protein [Labilithrix sp.]
MTPFASGAYPTTSLVQHEKDRRRAPRARLGVSVTITVAGKLVDALGADVSPGGMRVVAAERARVGDEVSLVFFLNGDIVSARGTVQWCAPTKRGLASFGVRFTMVEEDGPSLVASYCRASLS